MNVIQIIRQAAGGIGIPRPNSASGSSDEQVIQLLALLNEEGVDLAARTAWESLVREATFTTVAAASQGSLTTIIGAANAYRYIINDTIWNRTERMPVLGPKAPRNWQADQALSLTAPFNEYRIRGGLLLFDPVPTAGQTCAFEYVTKNWATSADGNTLKQLVTADEDEFLLDDSLLLQGLKWRWKKEKGFAYAEDFNQYERLVIDATARNGTKRRLSLGGASPSFRPAVIVPAGNWNQ